VYRKHQSEEVSFTKIQPRHFANLHSPHEPLPDGILRAPAPVRDAFRIDFEC